MPCELTVIVKDSERTLRSKHLIYDEIYVDQNDPIVKSLIDQTVKEFNSTPDSIKVNISLHI